VSHVVKAVNEFTHDFEDAPGISVGEILLGAVGRFEQFLISSNLFSSLH
jgi:hypothetical protein